MQRVELMKKLNFIQLSRNIIEKLTALVQQTNIRGSTLHTFHNSSLFLEKKGN